MTANLGVGFNLYKAHDLIGKHLYARMVIKARVDFGGVPG